MTLEISRFSSKQDAKPVRDEMDWLDFATLFSSPLITPCTWANCPQSTCPHKQGPCWSPAVFVDAAERCRSVTGVSLLVFDVDRASDDQIYEIRSRITAFRYLIHSTHSDRPGLRFVRIVIALSRQVSREAWGTFWRIVHQSIAPIADLTCSDAGRIYFFPSCPLDAHYFIQINEGVALDVDVALAQAAASHALAFRECLPRQRDEACVAQQRDEACVAQQRDEACVSHTVIVDQPPPIVTDLRPTWEIVTLHTAQLSDCPEGLPALVLTDMRERDAVGRNRYGTPLTSGNGRDHLLDAYQECLDMSVYLANELVEHGIGLDGYELESISSWGKHKYLFDVWKLYSSQLRATMTLRSLIEDKKKLVLSEEAP